MRDRAPAPILPSTPTCDRTQLVVGALSPVISPAAVATVPTAPAGNYAAWGAAWTVAFSLLGKLTTVATQFVLAWLLVPEEMGLVGLTLAVMNFTAIVGGANLKTLLVQRGDRFEEDARHAFWLALLLNTAAAGLLAASSPVAGLLFKEPRVIPLLGLAAVALPIQSLSTIYVASLHRTLRFGRVAAILFGASLIQNGSAVALAAAGNGAYSIIFPWLLNAIFMAVAFRVSAGRIAIARPNFRRSLQLCGPVGWLIANGAFVALLNSGPNLAVGLVQHDATAAGYYYWGASLSCQAVFLLVTNLQGVLFPVLARLNLEPIRQLSGAINACRILLVTVGSVCLAQALLAEPLINSIFHQRWEPAVPVVQWLSVGLITQPFNVLGVALLMAQGRFRQLTALSASIGIAVSLAALIGAQQGGPAVIAQWTGPTLLLSNFIAGILTFRQLGAQWSQLTAMFLRPAGVIIAVGVFGRWAGHATDASGALVQIIAVALTCGSTLVLTTAWLMPSTVSELIQRFQRNKPASSPTPMTVAATLVEGR
jgi:O-antigen/teichoic acid export membrane protein